MYWPLGEPRVYAAAKRRRKDSDANENDGEGGDEDEKEVIDNNPTALIGLRVARNGHLFATITKTALTIWQTSVGEK